MMLTYFIAYGITYLLLLFLLFMLWTWVFPQDALALIAKMRSELYRTAVEMKVRKETRSLAVLMKDWCKQVGYDPKLVDEVFDEQMQKITRQIRDKYDK